MSFTTLLADSGATVDSFTQDGNITGVQILSVSDQRLGARQAIFAQTGRRAEISDVILMKTYTTSLSDALLDRDSLEEMKGQRLIVTSQHAEQIEVFCHDMKVQVKTGAQKWLVLANMSCEAMPATITTPTTP